MAKFALEVLHAEHAVDVARVVAEQDTAKGSEAAEHVAPDGDWGLDPIDVA